MRNYAHAPTVKRVVRQRAAQARPYGMMAFFARKALRCGIIGRIASFLYNY